MIHKQHKNYFCSVNLHIINVNTSLQLCKDTLICYWFYRSSE